MNYLAHLHIATCAQSNLLGNLLGDFVKGNPDHQYSPDIAAGIRLHRRVDRFTDEHLISKQLKQLFPEPLRRYVPIALDMFWDHCLAREWQQYHHETLECFIIECQQTITVHQRNLDLPQSYLNLAERLWSQRWLQSYSEFDNICYALQRMSQRRIRLSGLSECSVYLHAHYDQLSDAFSQLYQLVIEDAVVFSQSSGLQVR